METHPVAVAPGNALFQLKKGGILAPAVFANLIERQEKRLGKAEEMEHSDILASKTGVFWEDTEHRQCKLVVSLSQVNVFHSSFQHSPGISNNSQSHTAQ